MTFESPLPPPRRILFGLFLSPLFRPAESLICCVFKPGSFGLSQREADSVRLLPVCAPCNLPTAGASELHTAHRPPRPAEIDCRGGQGWGERRLEN